MNIGWSRGRTGCFGGASSRATSKVPYGMALPTPWARTSWTLTAYGPDAVRLRVRLHEAMDAVPVGAHADGDRVPQHRREDRTQRGEIPHHPVIDKVVERRHEPLIHQGRGDFPVGGVPADQKDFLGKGFWHGENWRPVEAGRV